MAFAAIFDAKVFNKQIKDNKTPCMVPEARSDRTLILVVFPETFFEDNVGQDAQLR